uniref:Uncharacterized protein n=1 Tax=Monopterus albus TaxID=43700 RepID=A0A3Q3JYF0_MONAL
MIATFNGKQTGKHVVHIACGSTYSAAITADGELYTWGRGNYGRLGHGEFHLHRTCRTLPWLECLFLSLKMNWLLIGFQALVWSWGDGDYGKLGRGGSDGCKTPKLVEKLQDLDIVKVCCGSQFSVALTKDGQVYTWGKGDNQRLGHGTDEHVRYPKLLDRKKVVDVAVGSTHCLALTDDGEVHSWGSNDKLQHFDTLFSNKKQPKALPGLNSKHIVGISCDHCSSLGTTTPDKTKLYSRRLTLSDHAQPFLQAIADNNTQEHTKVAVHSGGRHAMALTVDGKIFSWGEGDDGKLGHFSRMYQAEHCLLGVVAQSLVNTDPGLKLLKVKFLIKVKLFHFIPI